VLVLLAALALALVAAGCGDDSSTDAGIPSDRKQDTTSPTPSPTPQAALTDTTQKPQVPKPTGEPPSELVVKDIVRGKGRKAKDGDTVTVHYVGVSYSTGEQFDASWDNGQPFSFPLGANKVIRGWDEGVAGMRVGGRRELTIPPDLAYGPAGAPPAIGPNETLIFVVDLLKID